MVGCRSGPFFGIRGFPTLAPEERREGEGHPGIYGLLGSGLGAGSFFLAGG